MDWPTHFTYLGTTHKYAFVQTQLQHAAWLSAAAVEPPNTWTQSTSGCSKRTKYVNSKIEKIWGVANPRRLVDQTL